MNTYELVVVSNRLPVTVKRVKGELVYEVSNGGLATAMSSLDGDAKSRIWVGWPGIGSDDLTPAERRQITRKLSTYGCYPVFLTDRQVHLFYEGYCNDTLWPLFHYFPEYVTYKDVYWQAYHTVNELFRKAIIKQAAANASIWIHDYHLLLLPQLVRAALPGSSIGFFLHTPFPSFEVFRQLPNRRELLDGLLGADLIGFHIYDYARHFLSSVLRLLGHESYHGSLSLGARTIKVDVFPIGIDYKKFKDELSTQAVKKELKVLDDYYRGRKLILSMDRLDFSKGILSRLEAYRLFLKRYPTYHKKVVLMMVAVPSRTEIETYRDLREDVERLVSQINGEYGTVDWAPISYQFKNLPFAQIVALMARSDVALVTPLRDGMNLVAKEYVATKQYRNGVLVLSEMVGASDELAEAIQINPNDRGSMVRAMYQALRMPAKEKKSRMLSMQKRLKTYNVRRWGEDFMEQLADTKQTQASQGRKIMHEDSLNHLVSDFVSAKRRLFCLDYDGTLRGFVKSPDASHAKPTREVMSLLRRLTALTNTRVCIISGRTHAALESWFGDMPLRLVAEHGAWVKTSSGWQMSEVEFESFRQKILPVLRYYSERTPGAEVEEKTFSVVWHYRNVPTELAYARNAALKHELNQLLADSDVEVHAGQKILEIKPRMIHKGYAVRDIVETYRPDFVFVAGDDYTDEDMFEAAPQNAHTLRVGLTADTRARHQVATLDGVLKVLDVLANVSDSER